VSILGVMPLRLAAVTVDAGDLATAQARLETLRRSLGAHLALYRSAAGVSQPELGQMIGRTPSMVSKIEHGRRGMSAELWKITDDVCGAQGALVAEHSTLTQVEQDYRAQCRSHRRRMQIQQAGARAQARSAWPEPGSSPGVLSSNGDDDAWLGRGLVSGQSAGLVEELMAVVTKLVRSVGRRGALQLVGSVLAAVGLSSLDVDEYTRIAQAVQAPGRTDARVVENLSITLAQCKRLEDTLGPCQVLDTLMAQHGLVRRLLAGGCPDNLIKPLKLVDSNTASTIGTCLINMDRPEAAKGYFGHARQAAHHAGNPACAAYAAANASFAAFLRNDTPTALDVAAAARSLAARTDDPRLKALAEQMAAAAYALDGQYGWCMAACDRAQQFLASSAVAPESLAYWVHEGTLNSQRSLFLCLLDKPQQAVDAASTARDRFNRTFVGSYARCQVRLGHALVLTRDIDEAARLLGDAASHASLSPRLTAELHTTRALMQPWDNTRAVATLDAQLQACGLTPGQKII
jgi:transcriptional regulator with XRE-family HTH domain